MAGAAGPGFISSCDKSSAGDILQGTGRPGVIQEPTHCQIIVDDRDPSFSENLGSIFLAGAILLILAAPAGDEDPMPGVVCDGGIIVVVDEIVAPTPWAVVG